METYIDFYFGKMPAHVEQIEIFWFIFMVYFLSPVISSVILSF